MKVLKDTTNDYWTAEEINEKDIGVKIKVTIELSETLNQTFNVLYINGTHVTSEMTWQAVSLYLRGMYMAYQLQGLVD